MKTMDTDELWNYYRSMPLTALKNHLAHESEKPLNSYATDIISNVLAERVESLSHVSHEQPQRIRA